MVVEFRVSEIKKFDDDDIAKILIDSKEDIVDFFAECFANYMTQNYEISWSTVYAGIKDFAKDTRHFEDILRNMANYCHEEFNF